MCIRDRHDALAAGIHNASLFQHRQQVGGVLQSFLASFAHGGPQLRHIVGFSGQGIMLVFEGMKQVFDGGEIVAGAEVAADVYKRQVINKGRTCVLMHKFVLEWFCPLCRDHSTLSI